MHSSDKISPSLAHLLRKVAMWRFLGDKIVFTNGCFDIVHLGHIDYLEKARALGTRLIVGINTDASVKKLKGESRPINDENARARMIAAFQFVDGVILFEEETPLNLISAVLPDVLVKGNDYSLKNIVGHEIILAHGGEVRTIELVQGYSTSHLIEKCKN
jgi:rfaE bifunctional protein nucleotidyltransferase chain/domain